MARMERDRWAQRSFYMMGLITANEWNRPADHGNGLVRTRRENVESSHRRGGVKISIVVKEANAGTEQESVKSLR